MERIDVLGYRPDRHVAFTRKLLAETNDEELQEIVKRAASELSSPIALVSLVLDQIQFFKAFIGLPPALMSARGTHRDASFCQFVVRDGHAFEVNDAPNDPRIPQHVVKQYNIQSYLGVPIVVEDIVVGSLCVLDTKKRGFSEQERSSLYKLAELVNKRLDAITTNRRQTRLDLTESILEPVLNELAESLKPIQHCVNLGYSANTSIRSFLELSKHLFSNNTDHSDAIRLSLEAAIEANKINENLLCDIEMAAADSEDCILALERLVLNYEYAQLSEVVISAQDLSRNAPDLVGGVPLPHFSNDPIIYTKGNLAIAIVTNCLLAISAELRKLESKNGIRLNVIVQHEFAELIFSAKDLNKSASDAAISRLDNLLGSNQPTVSINLIENKIKLIFKTKVPKLENNK